MNQIRDEDIIMNTQLQASRNTTPYTLNMPSADKLLEQGTNVEEYSESLIEEFGFQCLGNGMPIERIEKRIEGNTLYLDVLFAE